MTPYWDGWPLLLFFGFLSGLFWLGLSRQVNGRESGVVTQLIVWLVAAPPCVTVLLGLLFATPVPPHVRERSGDSTVFATLMSLLVVQVVASVVLALMAGRRSTAAAVSAAGLVVIALVAEALALVGAGEAIAGAGF